MKSLFINQSAAPESFPLEIADNPWMPQSINEIESSNEELNELALLAPTLAELSQQNRWVVLVGASKQAINYVNQASEINSERILLVHPNDQTDALWAIEQALMSGNSSAVLGWPGSINSRDHKRLLLAAKRTSALAFIFNETAISAPDIDLGYQDKFTGFNHTNAFH